MNRGGLKNLGKWKAECMSPDVVCPHKDRCVSHPTFCESCKNNTGKRNYYQPEQNYPMWPSTTSPVPFFEWPLKTWVIY